MGTKTGKYDAFCKVFVQLSDESQNKLVETAHRLLRTHQLCGKNYGGKSSVYAGDKFLEKEKRK